MNQSPTYTKEEADRYFERNGFVRNFIADYFLTLFPKETLATFDIAEFGIGSGQNLLLLKEYCKTVSGFDASERAIECFKSCFSARPDALNFAAQQVNLCSPFKSEKLFDVILFGFFAYYADEVGLKTTYQNTLTSIKPGGYVFIHDFLVRKSSAKTDSHNPALTVHKRDLSFWLQYFGDFDLIDFRLFDHKKSHLDKLRNEHRTIDVTLPTDDSQWTFVALFRKRS